VIIVHLVIIYDLVYLFDPLIVEEHGVVTLGDCFFAGYELIILGFHFETEGLDV